MKRERIIAMLQWKWQTGAKEEKKKKNKTGRRPG